MAGAGVVPGVEEPASKIDNKHPRQQVQLSRHGYTQEVKNFKTAHCYLGIELHTFHQTGACTT